MNKAIIWFRNNLRLADNEPLMAATAAHSHVIPLYIIDPRMQQNNAFGFCRTGDFRSQFLFECLENLKQNIEKCGGQLMVVSGKPEEILPKLCALWQIDVVYAPAEFTFDERQIEVNLQQKINLKLFWESILIHPDDLPFVTQNLPDVFTQFRNKVEKYCAVRECFAAPKQIIIPKDVAVRSEFALLKKELKHHPKVAMRFLGGEDAAVQRLQHYIWQTQAITTYKDTRNQLLGADYSSKFSAWLALGCISPRTIYHEIKKFETDVIANESTYWLVFELLWRDFFRLVALKFGNKLFLKNGLKPFAQPSKFNLKQFEKWRTGQTGEPFVDANMRELLYTGYMSNRGRQNVASYLVHDMNLDWRAGAAWFECQLVDYDCASNYGNWLYVAGLGNDPRTNRKFNVQRQAEMYDPDGAYVRHWLK